LGEGEDVEARDVGDGFLDYRRIELALGQQQPELLHFLLRREQVALGGVGEKLQRVGGRALLLLRQPRGDPFRQLVPLERIDGDRDAGIVERREPRRGHRAAIESRQRDQHQRICARMPGAILEHARAFESGLAARNAEVDQLAAAEQTQVAVGGSQRIPFEARFGDQHFAVVVAGSACGGAYLVAGLDRQQRLVAVHDVERGKAAAEMRSQLGGTDLHRCVLRGRDGET